MQWERAALIAPCTICGLAVQPGERILRPVEGDANGLRYTHLSCAKASLPSSPTPAAPESPVCKHWLSRGFCLFGEHCVFRHPPELQVLVQQQAQGVSDAAVAGIRVAGKRSGNQAGKRRVQPRNKFRAGAFRRFLLDTFGREKLGEGAGVLDVAGGKGELAFELLNLNGLPATVLEPRPLELERRVKWLLNGFYHWNPHHASYNDRVWISSALEQQAQQAQPSCSTAAEPSRNEAHAQQPQLPQHQPDAAAAQPVSISPAAAVGGVHMPDHLRLVVSHSLTACLMGRAADSSGSGQLPSLPPPEWPSVFQRAQQEARHGRWLKSAPSHEQAASAASVEPEQCSIASTAGGTDDSSLMPVESAGPAAPKTPELATPGLAALAAPQRRRAVAWSIPADSESEQEEALSQRAVGIGSLGGGVSNRQAASGSPPAVAAVVGQQQLQQLAKQRQAEPGQQEPREVEDAGEAWRRLTQYSVVVGMHPDQATEFVVDLAIAHGKPFAVVPCCVFSGDFPRRTLRGQAVTNYNQFCEYLVAKDPQHIQTATLPFEGRNRVLYRLAPSTSPAET